MAYRLGILDKSPVGEGLDAAEALRQSTALAQRADQLGYHRYWFAEHHSSPGLASSAPEIAAAHVLAKTSRIRVGTGGVMLNHYAPYKVAETFNLLSALNPGRVDLGVGKAPGGLPLSTRALKGGVEGAAPSFEDKLAELDLLLAGRLPEGHPLQGVRASPKPPSPPERILLGASPESAQLAAERGWQYCYAGHFDGDPSRLAKVVDLYRDKAGRPPMLAVVAFAAETEALARQHVDALRLYRVKLASGQTVNLPTLEAAAEFARQLGGVAYETEEIHPSVLSGAPAFVRKGLDRLHAQLGVEDFIIETPVTGFAERMASLEGLIGVAQAVAA
jgi:luciferase family oxidoreductase group 1